MGWRTYPARERDEADRKAQRIARIEAALRQALSQAKRDELEAELRALRLPPTV